MPIVVFPGTSLEVGQKQVELLVEKGLIKRVPDGGFTGDDAEAALQCMSENPAVMVCDFCGNTPVRYEYPAVDFTMIQTRGKEGGPVVDHSSLGSWVACDACAKMIDAGDLNALQTRGISENIARIPEERMDADKATMIGVSVSSAHALFWKSRAGERRRI